MTIDAKPSETLLGIDPGPRESAYVVLQSRQPVTFGKVANDLLLWKLTHDHLASNCDVVIETIFPRGQAVGLETMDTQFWAGRYAQAVDHYGRLWHKIDRQDVRYAICGSLNTNDANVRQALIDFYGGETALNRGGKCKSCSSGSKFIYVPCMECGESGKVPGKRFGENKKCPRCKGKCVYRDRVPCEACGGSRVGDPAGVLSGVKEDIWSALAIALAFSLRKEHRKVG